MSTENQLTRRNWRILTTATRDDRLSRGMLAVLAHILETQLVDEHSTAVRQDELASVAGLTRPNVSRALGKLVECGFLRLEERGDKHRPARYRPSMPGQGEEDFAEPKSDVGKPISEDTIGNADGIIEVTTATQEDGVVSLSLAWQTGDLAGTTEQATFDTRDPDERSALLGLVEAAGIETLNDAAQLIGAIVRVNGEAFERV